MLMSLGLMKELFAAASNACLTRGNQSLDTATAILTIQAVIAQNEATMEAVSTMLKCSCSQDGYLLTIMSLILFKMVGWYAAVARRTPSSQGPPACYSHQSLPSAQVPHKSTVVGNYCLEGPDSPRMAAQLVLSELHRVRSLVDQLSSKLELQAAKEGRRGVTETPEGLDLENEMTLPLSAVMYDLLDIDLRRRLRALSLDMIDRLRKL